MTAASQQVVDGPHAIEDALGIVEAFDADGKLRVAAAGRSDAAPPSRHCAHRRLAGECRGRPFDRDGIGPNQGFVPADGNGSLLAIDPALHEAIGCFEKVVAVELRVEAEDGAAEQPVR